MLDAFLRDGRTAARALWRSPGFSAMALLTLAIGIGSNTAVFSVIRTVILRPLPYPAPGELVMLWTTLVEENVLSARSAHGNVEDWRERSRTLAAIAVYDPIAATERGGSVPERLSGARVSPELFPLLGVPAKLGRTFTAAEAQRREPLVVLSEAYWKRRFDGDPAVLGRSLLLDDVPRRIIGVMPAGFRFPGRQTAFWEPHTLFESWDERRGRRGTDTWFVIARLDPNSRLDEARVEMRALAEQLARAYPERNAGLGIRVVPLRDQVVGGNLALALWVLWGAVGLVLLIACVNVANLLIARSASRRRELAIRSALGADRSQLLRLVLTESMLLGLLGGAIGTLGAMWTLELLPGWSGGQVPRLEGIAVDGTVLAFSLVLSSAAGVLFGLAPGLQASRTDLISTLAEGGRSTGARGVGRLRRALVVTELALAVITLTGAGLLGRSLMRVLDLDPGFETSRVLYARMALRADSSPTERAAFYHELLERVGSINGVTAAGAIDDFFISNNPDRRFTIEGVAEANVPTRSLAVDEVTPEFFRTLSVPLLHGRMFTERDRADSTPVALVNETMARLYWPGEDPVGRRIQLGAPVPDGSWLTIVGVVGDFRRSGPEIGTVPQLFRPHAQNPSRSMNLFLKTTLEDPTQLASGLRTQVAAVDPRVPVYDISPLPQRMGRFVSQRRFLTQLLATFSTAAMLLAAVGVHGLVAQAVQQRTAEIGVRMTLGATRRNIMALVLGEGLIVTAIGLAAGLVGALALARLLRGLLFEVSPADPATLIVVGSVLATTSVVSSYVPALRASRLDPGRILQRAD